MASLIPSLNSCLPRMTAGEKRFGRMLESHLEEDYLCWYEIPVGIRRRHTDFIILHPRRGLLMLEVKDWKLDTIQTIDRHQFTLLINGRLKKVANPLEQVRQCCYQLTNALEKDPVLRHSEGPFAGKLCLPYAFGTVFTNITRNAFQSHQFYEVIPEHLSICKDEMTPSVDMEDFQKRLWNMFAVQFSAPLSLPQIDRVRWHLFPEIRIKPPVQGELIEGDGQETPDDEDLIDTLFPKITHVMDKEQERLARGLGEGHRVIHGVAGSGKTLILGYRCQQLAATTSKPILVLCFNVTLAARLREIIRESKIDGRVHVRHFHKWCGEQLRTYHVPLPAPGHGYVSASVKAVIEGVANGQIPPAQYGAVMIDEGHDFEPEWLRLIIGMLDPDTNSLLLLYDDAQSLYSRSRELGFSLSSVGIRARGRTTILRVNYRNTDEIINFAYRFASNWLVPNSHDDEDENNVPLIEPESAGRHGPAPAVKLLRNFDEEVDYIARCVESIGKRGTAWADICITYRSTWMGELIKNALVARNLPVHWLKNTPDKLQLSQNDQRIKLMTMHSSKGLEFPFVVVAGTGHMPSNGVDTVSEAKLLYVAMTRATDKLLITAHQSSRFLEKLELAA